MTETPIDLPVGLRWIKLVCRLGRLVTDSAADANAYPDLLPVGGTLTLAASPSRVRIQEADGHWRSVDVAGRQYTIRADGELVDNEDRVGVYIPDPTSPLIEPQNYTITAAVKPTIGAGWNVTISGSDILPDVVDLVAVSSVGTVSPSVTTSFDARLYALEQGGGGGGTSSGIELVSGTVTLGSSGTPIREFYATGSATINGVTFPAGTAVVFRRSPAGQWGYKVVDDWTSVGTELITVSASAPTWTDDAINGGGTWTTPTITGVTYSPASGTATPGEAVTVSATAQTGYQLAGTTSWQHTFPAAPVAEPGTLTYRGHQVFGETPLPSTYDAAPIGAASATREVIVLVSYWSAGLRNVASVTIGGIAATQDFKAVSGESNPNVWLYRANVPSGTTADVVVSPVGANTWAPMVGVWTVDKPVAFVGGAQTDVVSSNEMTVNVPAAVNGGFAIGGFRTRSNAFGTVLTGLTERFDTATAQPSVGGDGPTTGPLTVTATLDAAPSQRVVLGVGAYKWGS